MARTKTCQNALHVCCAISSIRIFSSRVEKINLTRRIGQNTLKMKVFQMTWRSIESIADRGLIADWGLASDFGYVLCSPSRMSMHANPNSCQKCRSTSHPSFVHQGCVYYLRQFLSLLQTSMLKCWFLSEHGNHGVHGVLAAKYIRK